MNRPPFQAIVRAPIIPDRVRKIAGETFAFLPHRFLRDGFFVSLAPQELRLYVLLVLVADRNGVSFYSYDRLCSILELPLEDYLDARNALIDKDLVATDGTRMQVLSLPDHPTLPPPRPLRHDTQRQDHDPATIRAQLLSNLRDDSSD